MRYKESKFGSFTIRLEPILLIVEICKLAGYNTLDWSTIIIWFVVPFIIGKYMKHLAKKILAKQAAAN